MDLLQKLLATDESGCAMAFESPAFEFSYMQESTLEDSTSSEYKAINVYSQMSVLSVIETSLPMNVRLPAVQTFFQPANPYKTFCLVVAGGTMTDQFDGLCNQIIGKDFWIVLHYGAQTKD
jgi:hypothetical protein